MEKWYFTFGMNQKHENHYAVIEATSRDLARKKMFDIFGSEWAFQYSEKQWEKAVENHHYKELDLNTLKEK